MVGARHFTVAVTALVAFAPAASAERSANVTITAAPAAPWVAVGSRVGITGKVTPHPAGIRVTLEQQAAGGWRAVGTASVHPDGAFSFVTRPDKPGPTNYRVATSTGADLTGSSAPVHVKVLEWSFLADIDAFIYARPIVGDISTEPIKAGGVTYEHPVSLDAGCYNPYDGSFWIDYNLAGQYRMFAATVAIEDAAPSPKTATYTIFAGGKILASGSLADTGSKKVSVSVDGMNRLRLRVNVPDVNHSAGCSEEITKVVFGDARLLGA
jgi:hypothetical protein